MPDTPVLPTTTVLPVLNPGAPSDSAITNSIGDFMAANPLNPDPGAPAPAAPAAPAATAATAAPAVAKPFDIQGMLKAATPGAPTPPAPAEPEVEYTPPEAREEGAARNAWTKTKAENKALRASDAQKAAKIAELETKLAAQPAVDPKVVTELETAKQQILDYENQIGQIEITRSKAFKQKYDAKIQNLRAKAVDDVATLSERSKEDAVAMMQALEQAPTIADAKEMLSGEGQAVQGAALLALVEIQRELKVREAAIADWRNTKPAVETELDRETTGERLKTIVDQTSAALQVLAKPPEEQGEGSWLLMDQPDDVEWTARRQGILSTARAELRDGKNIPKLVLEGVAARYYREFGEAQYARAQELEAHLARRNRATPRVDGGDASGRPDGQPAAPATIKPVPIQQGIDNLVGEWQKTRTV